MFLETIMLSAGRKNRFGMILLPTFCTACFASMSSSTLVIDAKAMAYSISSSTYIFLSDYKLKLKAYSKRRFDPFCRWDRIAIPYKDDTHIQTTIGQLNFFKWALEHKILDYIMKNFDIIEKDMNKRNSTAKRKDVANKKTRKKREELSISASKSIKKEKVEIIVKFN